MDDLTLLLETPFPQALEIVEGALKAEGFGVVTRIDVQRTIQNQLSVDFRPFMILGACHPPITHRALQHDPSLAVLLPCNISVEATAEGATLVRLADPALMLQGRPADATLDELASEIREKLLAVAARVRYQATAAGQRSKPWERLVPPPLE
jgi:uncharacterized protein (DUF302 family)